MKTTAIYSILLLAVVLPLPAIRAAEPPVARSLAPSDWSGLRSAHEAWRHRFEREEDGSHLAHNPGQQWSTRFDGSGFSVKPAGEDWTWGLELRSYGLGDHRLSVSGEARVETAGQRLSYFREGTLEEWFLNDARGLEQGWTLGTRPAGIEGGKLRLDLAVRGGLESAVKADGRGVDFKDASGDTVITYGGLKAWDATGRGLSVRFLSLDEASGIAVEVDERDAVYPVTIDPVAQQARLQADNAGTGDAFGRAVAISGDTVVVGAPNESGPGDVSSNSGAAYVFVRTGNTWTQQGYLRAFNAGINDGFGDAVAISGDLIVVGAKGEDGTAAGDPSNNGALGAGAAYVFSRTGGTWSLQSRLKASNAGPDDAFGISVAISNEFVVVGANGEDQTINNPAGTNDDGFNDGAAYVFAPDGMGGWVPHGYLKGLDTDAADRFGSAVSISGNTIAVGAPDDGGGGGGSFSGRVFVFTLESGVWTQQAFLKADNAQTNDNFGLSVALSGDTVVVGAPYEDDNLAGVEISVNEDIGAAYVFTRDGVVWSQQARLKASNAGPSDYFGEAVAIAGDIVVVGAQQEDGSATQVNGADNDFAPSAGAAYVYLRRGATWTQEAYLKGSNSTIGAAFGRSVAVSGTTIIAGASGEDSSAGASYAFVVTQTPPSAPTLKITGKKTVRVRGSKTSHLVRGTAADLNGDLRTVEAKDARPKGVKKFRRATGTAKWSYRAPLKVGRNTILVRAVDATGALSKVSRLTVIRD